MYTNNTLKINQLTIKHLGASGVVSLGAKVVLLELGFFYFGILDSEFFKRRCIIGMDMSSDVHMKNLYQKINIQYTYF